MSKYEDLLRNPAKIEVKENAKEVIFYTCSCMCDNQGKITFKLNKENEFNVSGGGFSLSNWQMKGDYFTDLRWAADDRKWNEVARIINTGTARVSSIRSR